MTVVIIHHFCRVVGKWASSFYLHGRKLPFTLGCSIKEKKDICGKSVTDSTIKIEAYNKKDGYERRIILDFPMKEYLSIFENLCTSAFLVPICSILLEYQNTMKNELLKATN